MNDKSIPFAGTFPPNVTLIPSSYLQDGQRFPVGGDVWVISRVEYDRISDAIERGEHRREEER